ncbi:MULTISPECIES: tol-pal system YbgF family protein [Anaeromyxobacter]|uniref:tetratricopeptide repeat protein n=1 Tax=Anaeromyxobacter TaxID=161492 RepID=UPI001F5A197D|nr:MULTISPECIES: tetratricopeptide repeat protein [unclassified Anaeromyxobacter]
MIPLLIALVLTAPPELKRAKDRFEFGAYADAAGTLRRYLATGPSLSEDEAIDAYRILGISEYHLGDQAQARAAFVNLLSHDPDYALDPFLVPPPIVEFFDRVKREHEPALAPLRERRRALREQERLADEAKRRLLAEEQARTGPPTKVVRVQERLYLFNWMPLGAGQFQNGDRAKGTAIAAGQIVAGVVNLSAIIFHNQLAEDRTRSCISGQPGCSRPPYSDSDRVLLGRVEAVKYVSAGLFWALYAYGVWDAHKHFVPIVETEVSPGGGAGSVKLEWAF